MGNRRDGGRFRAHLSGLFIMIPSIDVVMLYGVAALVALAFMSIVFAVACRMRRYDVVDIAWGLVFIVIALTTYVLQPEKNPALDTSEVATALVVVWGARLTWHIFSRFRKSSEEDRRYQELRAKWKTNTDLNAYFRIFITQALLALIVILPVAHINLVPGDKPLTAFALVGILTWLIGFAFETIGDRQLRDHIADSKNKGKLMTSGLWRYTRHPNYFGEVTQWWGLGLLALSTPYGWFSLLGPVVITVLIVFISGVPLLEKKYEGRPGWTEYKARTSKLFPLPPKQ